MNKRTEEKLKDLSGMSKAVNELLGQAWERGRKYGEKEQTEVKGDLISREALIRAFLNHNRTEFEIKNHCRTDENVIALIQNAPTVEYQNPTIIEADREKDNLPEVSHE